MIGLISILCIALGFVASRRLPRSGLYIKRLAFCLINGLYPALIFSAVFKAYRLEQLDHEKDLIFFAFGLMAIGALVGVCLGRTEQDGARRATVGAIATAGNYVFLPFPIAWMLWGEDASVKVLLSTLGSDLGLWLLAAGFFKSGVKERLLHLCNAPLVTLLVTIGLIVLGVRPQDLGPFEPAVDVLQLCGRLVVPVAMMILGAKLASVRIRSHRLRAHLGLLGWRLIGAPAAMLLCITWWQVKGQNAEVLMLIASMPTAIGTVFLAELYHGDGVFAAESVLLSHVLALGTVPLWVFGFLNGSILS